MRPNSNLKYLILLGVAVVGLNCRKPYLPPATKVDINYLVVEGVIDPGSDSTIIKLSRTVKISDKTSANPELNAAVTVESDAGATYPLAGAGDGRYIATNLNLDIQHKYRLAITTADNRSYKSDLVEVKNSPPIDSANYILKNDGVRINVNAHDPTNKTRYYRWAYTETYIIHAIYNASVEWVKEPHDTIVFRTADHQIFMCWRNENSANIVLGSSSKLQQDVITQNQLLSIPSTSEKIGDRYSILVSQYALTREAFDYWGQLKKNSEQLGSIFDAQPSELTSNIHCMSNPAEPVLGYVSVGTHTVYRLYVDSRKLPNWIPTPYTSGCFTTSYALQNASGQNDVKLFIFTGLAFPIGAVAPPGGPITGYITTTRECADCTLRGTNHRPAFWTDTDN